MSKLVRQLKWFPISVLARIALNFNAVRGETHVTRGV